MRLLKFKFVGNAMWWELCAEVQLVLFKFGENVKVALTEGAFLAELFEQAIHRQ